MAKEYHCDVYLMYDGSDEEPDNHFFMQVWDNEGSLAQSTYQRSLDDLLTPLIEARKKFPINQVTSPATRFHRLLGQIQIQIPDPNFTEFLKKYQEKTKDIDLHE